MLLDAFNTTAFLTIAPPDALDGGLDLSRLQDIRIDNADRRGRGG